MSDDRRATLEAAMDAVEDDAELQTNVSTPTDPGADTPFPATARVAAPSAAPSPTLAPKPDPDGSSVPPVADGGQSDRQYAVDKPPQSWRTGPKAKWDSLDPEVRQEVIRRDRDIERTLAETSQDRQISRSFQQVVAPYMARIQSTGMSPVGAIQELLKADHVLTTAPQGQRAAFMAKMIKDYGVDIRSLDEALSGQPTEDPIDSRVDRLVAERLKPFQEFVSAQTQYENQQRNQHLQSIDVSIEQMSADFVKFPEFDNVREDMADLIDLQAKKGVYLNLEQAYSRAIAMNPEASKRVTIQNAAEAKRVSALAANAKAQKALSASRSVGGAPNNAQSGVPTGDSRRSAIEAAFEQAEGR